VDGEGREIAVRALDGDEGESGASGESGAGDGLEALVEMYLDFDPSDRAQGIPPVGEDRIREWLDVLREGREVGATGGSETSDTRAGSAGRREAPPDERAADAASEATREGYNVVAWHGDRAVGHATLVPDDGAFELAIFVHQDYQGAGVGTETIRTLLGHGAAEGVERVWLTVERWNRAAVSLYESQGFETTSGERFDLEMSLRLDSAASVE
jgi:ribosomal protein S18 acetylase RimI-like enzyme